MVIGSVLLATNVTIASAATTTLSLSSTAAGVTCDNANTSAPVCTGVAAGDVVAASGTGFDKGALASIEECNDITSQPVTLFLGADIPVSCTPISITSISATGTLAGTKTLVSGITGPPTLGGGPPTCTQVSPSTSAITGCKTSGNITTDAKSYPCPAHGGAGGRRRDVRAGHR